MLCVVDIKCAVIKEAVVIYEWDVDVILFLGVLFFYIFIEVIR